MLLKEITPRPHLMQLTGQVSAMLPDQFRCGGCPWEAWEASELPGDGG